MVLLKCYWDVSWNNSGTMWLNPDIEYELNLPFNEPNGISDIEYVIFDLASLQILME